MMTLKELSEFAQLAQAAYVDNDQVADQAVVLALRNAPRDPFSETQANQLIGPDGYSVAQCAGSRQCRDRGELAVSTTIKSPGLRQVWGAAYLAAVFFAPSASSA